MTGCAGTTTCFEIRLRQKLAPSRYRTMEVRVILRFAALSALSIVFVSAAAAQSPAPATPGPSRAQAVVNSPQPVVNAPAPALTVDQNDPMVVRARERLDQVTRLVSAGALPLMRLQKAQEDVQDAMDMALLKNNLYSTNMLPEEADQLVQVAQRMVLRRQKSLNDMRELVSAGVLSRSEAEASGDNLDRAQQELDLAESRAKLIEQMAEGARIQKAMASLELEAPQHPEWDGKVYTHYAGNGIFTPGDLQSLEVAYLTHFAKPMPISAEGETALHRSFGFDHRGRVDVAVNPDQPEGVWLMRYLESKRIPYFAFRAAVPHKATGPHIHVGPESTRLTLSD
jgi:hypothetical protein